MGDFWQRMGGRLDERCNPRPRRPGWLRPTMTVDQAVRELRTAGRRIPAPAPPTALPNRPASYRKPPDVAPHLLRGRGTKCEELPLEKLEKLLARMGSKSRRQHAGSMNAALVALLAMGIDYPTVSTLTIRDLCYREFPAVVWDILRSWLRRREKLGRPGDFVFSTRDGDRLLRSDIQNRMVRVSRLARQRVSTTSLAKSSPRIRGGAWGPLMSMAAHAPPERKSFPVPFQGSLRPE